MEHVKEKYLHSELTSLILQAYYKVYNNLGYGFTKSIYENALLRELKQLKLEYEHKKQIEIYYQSQEVGTIECDITVKNSVVVQVQTNDELESKEEQKLTNILKSSIYEVGLILNFGRTPEHKRKVYTNDLKNSVD